MHISAKSNAKRFFETYCSSSSQNLTIVEIGSQDVNGSIRELAPANSKYIGLDFVEGKGVDLILENAYFFPLENESVDVVVTSSCFEHSEMFWLTFLESLRVLKPHGLLYINAPSNGDFHRYPGDSWRFYPDSGSALEAWAHKNNYNTALLESYISKKEIDVWNDFIAIFVKDKQKVELFPNRITSRFSNFYNGKVFGEEGIRNYQSMTEDMEMISKYEQDLIKIYTSFSWKIIKPLRDFEGLIKRLLGSSK